jgi:hypothetical protein
MCRRCSIHPTWRWRSASPFSPSNPKRTHFPQLRGTVYPIVNTEFITGIPEKIGHTCYWLWHSVVLCADTKISEEHAACICGDNFNRCYIILEIGRHLQQMLYNLRNWQRLQITNVFTMKIDAAYTSKSLLSTYQTMRCHKSTDDCLTGVTTSNLGTIPVGN